MATKHKHDATSVHQFAEEAPGPRVIDSHANQPESGAVPNRQVEVRQLTLGDCGAVSRFRYRSELMYPESACDHPGRFGLMTRRLLGGEYSHSPMFVARCIETRHRLGMLQCLQQGVDDRWYLQYLSSQEEVYDGNAVDIALLEYAIGQAGWRGARRIMARSGYEDPLTGTLRRVGFSAFTHEYVYAIPQAPVGNTARRARVQERSDVWSIHQLYLQTTPRDVQNAEALTSHVWDIDTEGRSKRGWFVPGESGAIAYVRVRTNRKHHLIDAMFLPEAFHQVPELFQAVFQVLRNESPRPVFVLVRGYQQELDSLMESLGFTLERDQLVMVRYTTVPVPSSVRPVEAFERLRTAEGDARRVPSFYVRDVHE